MRKTVAALISAAATVTMITGAGVATAATSHPAGTHRAATRAAVTQRAVTGTEHFQDVSASLTSNKSPVAAYGAFNAGGVDTQLGHRTDLFKFPGGSFLIKHKATRSSQHFSKTACAGVQRQRGTYKISGGTGKYAGITGSGHFRLRVLIVARHTAHGCSQRPVAVQVIIRAHGPVTLP
jgi:hypothetical protein